MISLVASPDTEKNIEENGKFLRAEYDSKGRLKKIIPGKKSEKSEVFLDVKDWNSGATDLFYPSSGFGYYTLPSKESGKIDICFGSSFEDSRSTIKTVTFEEWINEVTAVFLGKQKGFLDPENK